MAMNKTIVSLACGFTGIILGTIIGYELGDYFLEFDCIEEKKDSHFVLDVMKKGAIIGGIAGVGSGMYVYDHIKKNKCILLKRNVLL